MSLFGSLGIAVTGVNAQSAKLGNISDNIANINTVGYKQSVARFGDLITDSSVSTYSAQGVLAGSSHYNSSQGLLTMSNSPTDIGISGNGFFVVNSLADGSGQRYYTRAGSFEPDAEGNFRNMSGFYLQAWPLDADGNVDTNALQTVNIQNIEAVATATTQIELRANLNASQTVFPGAGVTAVIDPIDNLNANNTAADIIVPNPTNGIQRGDQFTVTLGTTPASMYTYTYGGFTIGRNVNDATAVGNGDNGINVPATSVTPAGYQSVGGGSGDVDITIASTAGLYTGSVVMLTGAPALVCITGGQMNGQFVITVLSPTTFRITTTGSDPAVGGTAAGSSGTATLRPYAGNIFDATNTGESFFGTTGTTNLRAGALSFTITTAASGTQTFTYVAGAPDTVAGQFNSMTTLAQAIDQVSGLSARVVGGRLVVGADDANAAVTFANGQAAGTAGPPVLSGVDWIGSLGLANVGAGTGRFSTLNSLSALVSNSPGLTASPTLTSLGIRATDPQVTIDFADRPITPPTALAANAYTTTAGSNTVTITAALPATAVVGDTINLSGLAAGTYNGIPSTALNGNFIIQAIGAGTFDIVAAVAPGSVTAGSFGLGGELLSVANNSGSLVSELGMTPSLAGAPLPNPVPDTGILGPAYDPLNDASNIAGGGVAAQFSRDISVYDAEGNAHTVNIGFIKTATNSWAAEVYVTPASDVVGSVNGQIAFGPVTFNGDGTLAAIGGNLGGALTIPWANGNTNTITFDLGTAGAVGIGDVDGLSQLSGPYEVQELHQNGVPVGDLTGVEISANGDIVGKYSNGLRQALFRIPLAMFAEPNELQSVSGTAFLETTRSGTVRLEEPNNDGAGKIAPSQLESSNADLAQQLTEMIIAQRSYQFNSRLISTSNDMLQNLTQM